MFIKDGIPIPHQGTDIPAWFIDDLKAIDKEFTIILHPYDIIWDDIINYYLGPLDNPRFNIHWEGGYKIFGWPLKTNKDALKPDGKWHLWRYCWPYGYAHVAPLETTEGGYLNIIVRRLHFQARFRDKYGHIAWNKLQKREQEEIQEKMLKDREEEFSLIQDENKWLMKRAMENLASGKVQATRPEKEIIYSGAGLNKKSKIVRPITDEEGGLIIPGR